MLGRNMSNIKKKKKEIKTTPGNTKWRHKNIWYFKAS